MTTPDRIQRGIAAWNEGQKLQAQKRLAEAARCFQRALSLMPDHPNVLVSAGKLAEEMDDWAAAERVYRRLVQLRPLSGAEGKLAVALFKLQRYGEAIPFYESFFTYRPEDPDMLHALCNCLCIEGRWEAGLAIIRRALAIREDSRYRDAEFNALYHLGRTDELDARLDDMLARYPDSREIRSLYSLHHLKSGDFGNGFRFYDDLRWRNDVGRPVRRMNVFDHAPPWDGVPFEGVVIVISEQGVGDEIMVSSMFEDLRAGGQRFIVECDERLLPIYRRGFPDLEFVPRQQEKRLDFPPGTKLRSATALDLARVYRNAAERFPARRQWLSPEPARAQALRERYRARWPGKRLVGLSWKSSRVMEGGGSKNIDITDFVPMLADRDTTFINLQYGNIAADLATIRGAGVSLFVDEDIDTMNDLDGLAAQISALDLVVSTSNTTVHVAGAMGVPCWLLLPRTRPILWYWGYRGSTTPWYPSLRLWRNGDENTWVELLAAVQAELATFPVGQ